LNYWQPFRLLALLSLLALVALFTGEAVFLWSLLFLLFLLPIPGHRSEDGAMGFLPFVNEGGQRVVRWHRVVLVWVFVISASMFGSCGMGYLLVGDWRYGAFVGMAMGVTYSAMVTARGLTCPVARLPSIH
jgi:hypothetical protein